MKLLGVRELFEKYPELRKRRTRYDIYIRGLMRAIMNIEMMKMELLNKYVSEGLLEEQSETKAMLNIQR